MIAAAACCYLLLAAAYCYLLLATCCCLLLVAIQLLQVASYFSCYIYSTASLKLLQAESCWKIEVIAS